MNSAMNWVERLLQDGGMPPVASEWVSIPLALFAAIVGVILPSAYWYSFWRRKLNADLQARVGPNRAGPYGILQPFSDLLKLLQKTPHPVSQMGRRWRRLHTLALFSSIATLPLGSLWLLAGSELGVLLPFWSAFVLTLGALLVGLERGTVPGWMGGIRLVAQSVTAAFPALVCVLAAGARSSGFSWKHFALDQGFSPSSWGAIGLFPFQLIAFGVFLVSGLALLNAEPFDTALGDRDLHGGVASTLSGEDLAWFEFGRFYVFLHWILMSVVLFLGGWRLPDVLNQWVLEQDRYLVQVFLELSLVLSKGFLVMLIITWVSRSIPRLRTDHITDLSWRVLSPLALVALIGSAAFHLLRGAV